MTNAFTYNYSLADGSTLTVTGTITPKPVVTDTPNLIVIGSASIALAGTNIARGVGAIVRYVLPQTVTTTNQWGVEVTVDAAGRVSAVNDRQPSGVLTGTPVPADGYVLSGHGSGRDWLLAHATVGVTVKLTTGTITPPHTTDKTLAVYLMMWPGPGKSITNIPAQVNEIRLSFAQGSPPALVGWANDGQAAFVAGAAAFRARGGRVLVSIGGAGGPCNTSDRSGFLSGIANIRSQLNGNLDGIDWDIEACSMNAADVLAISSALKSAYGASFRITFAPNGGNVSEYLPAAVACQKAGCLDSYGQQFYEAPVSVSAALGRINEAINEGIPANKINVGMMIASDSSHWTLSQCVANYKALVAAVPGLNGAYLWESARTGTAEWATQVGALVFA